MKTTLKSALGAAALAVAGTSGHAATITNVSGTVCEGGVRPAIRCSDARVLGDFGTNPASTVLEIVDDFALFGGIAHHDPTRFYDGWSMDFGTAVYDLVFGFQTKGNTPLFDGVLTVGGTTYDFSTTDEGTIALGPLTGLVTFLIDPISGAGTAREEGTWDLQIAAVPLPGAAFLLLGALGGLGVASRRKKA